MDMLQPVSSFYPYNESSRFLQHVGTNLPDYVVPQNKRQQSKHFANGIYFKKVMNSIAYTFNKLSQRISTAYC